MNMFGIFREMNAREGLALVFFLQKRSKKRCSADWPTEFREADDGF
jgi:hypothetical protein